MIGRFKKIFFVACPIVAVASFFFFFHTKKEKTSELNVELSSNAPIEPEVQKLSPVLTDKPRPKAGLVIKEATPEELKRWKVTAERMAEKMKPLGSADSKWVAPEKPIPPPPPLPDLAAIAVQGRYPSNSKLVPPRKDLPPPAPLPGPPRQLSAANMRGEESRLVPVRKDLPPPPPLPPRPSNR